MRGRLNTTIFKSICQGGLPSRTLANQSLLSGKARSPQILFFFMERFSNSRSWRSAMKLAAHNNWFDDHNIIVILVGDGEHLMPANRLADEMGLPFLLLADHTGALWRRFARSEFKSLQRRDAYVLVDLCGRVQYSIQDQRFGLNPAADQLVSSMVMLH